MPEAINFLENWIEEKGPNLERLGMLAWANGCTGEFSTARSQWEKLVLLAKDQPADEVLVSVPYTAYTLVDCLSAGGELALAKDVAREAWQLCGDLGPLPVQESFKGDGEWLALWHLAERDVNEIAPILLARHPESAELTQQASHLTIYGWLNRPKMVEEAWFKWAQACLEVKNYQQLESYRLVMLGTLRNRGYWQNANHLAEQIWQMLEDCGSCEEQKARPRWDYERFNPVPAIDRRHWKEAQELVLDEIRDRGVQGAVGWAAIVFGGSGSPTPPEIMRALEENGISQVDEYGMFGWYLTAREAGHSGDLAKAFNALRKALSYWSNSPYWITDLWEQDAYWGNLRNHPEFKKAFDLRRERIGKIFGKMHYFPDW